MPAIRVQCTSKQQTLHGKLPVVSLQFVHVAEDPAVKEIWPGNPHAVINIGNAVAAFGDQFAMGKEYLLTLAEAPPLPPPASK